MLGVIGAHAGVTCAYVATHQPPSSYVPAGRRHQSPRALFDVAQLQDLSWQSAAASLSDSASQLQDLWQPAAAALSDSASQLQDLPWQPAAAALSGSAFAAGTLMKQAPEEARPAWKIVACRRGGTAGPASPRRLSSPRRF